MLPLRWLATSLLFVTLGCAPTMRSRTLALEAYRSPELCGQGPYELVLKAAGAAWGETLEVRALSPHPLRGYSQVLVDGEPHGERTPFGAFTVGREVVSTRGRSWEYARAEVQEPENARCLRPAATEGTTPVLTAPATPSPPLSAEAAAPTPTPSAVAQLERAPTPSRVAVVPGPEWMAQQRLGSQVLQSVTWTQAGRSLPLASPLPASAEIRVRIWSEQPNLLEGVLFAFLHAARQPSVSDDAWLAYLARQDEEFRRESAAQLAAIDRANAARRERCAAHPERDECAQRLTPLARAAPPDDEAPRPAGPPPPPRPETRPPKPSPNAAWISGYWRWYAARWVWSPGGWEVPEEDLAAERTVVAPAAPPALRVELRPPMPAPRMVWARGYWQWDGTQWVWVAGAWTVPKPDATYVAPRWQPAPRGMRFIPGRWEIRVGR